MGTFQGGDLYEKGGDLYEVAFLWAIFILIINKLKGVTKIFVPLKYINTKSIKGAAGFLGASAL